MERMVGVKNGTEVSVVTGALITPVGEAVAVLITNRSGVLEAGKAKGVAVGAGGLVGVGACRNGIETGNEEQPESRESRTAMWTNRFMIPLYLDLYSAISCAATTIPFQVAPRAISHGSHCGCQSGSGSVVTWRRLVPSVRMINISA